MPPAFLLTGPPDAAVAVILAHGAGAAMDTPFMTHFAESLAAAGVLCVRFEFPYMARRRADGGKRPPDRAPLLLETWRQAVAEVRRRFAPRRLVIGGKSMGGRMASLIADEVAADGLVVLGYPFHAAGKPATAPERVGHLAALSVPTLIIQGTRDTLGDRGTVAGLTLAPSIRVVWCEDGDHSLKPRKTISGRTERQALDEAAGTLVAFLHCLDEV